jgi:hypothetical protein
MGYGLLRLRFCLTILDDLEGLKSSERLIFLLISRNAVDGDLL